MFTGIVEELGRVKGIVRGTKSVRLTVSAQIIFSGIKQGDSIAVNGVCLTVTEYSNNWFTADVMPETVNSTALAALKTGDAVNLERALRVEDRLGGHIVSGHIDGVGIIRSKENNDNAIILGIHTASEIMRYIVKKGSITVDGLSLTVVEYGQDWFTVSLIPHTASMTTLGIKTVGHLVNLETDVLAKYVEKLLGINSPQSQESKTDMTIEFLAGHGFTI